MLNKRSVVDLVGVAAVVASLIFVGVQVQQGASATRSATVLQLKDSWVQLNLALATSPELSNAFDIVETQGWDTNPQANRLVAAFYRALFHTWSNAYYQFLNGTLEEDQYLSSFSQPWKFIFVSYRHVGGESAAGTGKQFRLVIEIRSRVAMASSSYMVIIS